MVTEISASSPSSALRSRDFRCLLASRVLTLVGGGAAAIGLQLHLADDGDAARSIGFLFAALAAADCFGPVVALGLKRLAPRTWMAVIDVAQCAIFAWLAWQLPTGPVLYGCLLVSGLCTTSYVILSRGLTSRVLGISQFRSGVGLLAVANNSQNLLGPLVGSSLFELGGVRGVLYVNALSFLVSAVLVLLVRHDAGDPHRLDEREDDHVGRRAGMPGVYKGLLAVSTVVYFVGAVANVGIVLLLTRDLDFSAQVYGILFALLGVGGVLGGVVYGRMTASPTAIALGGLAGTAASLAGLAYVQEPVLAGLVLLLSGVMLTLFYGALVEVVLSAGSLDGVTMAGGWAAGCKGAGVLGGYLLSGYAFHFSVRTTLLACSCALLVSCVVLTALGRSTRSDLVRNLADE